AGQRRETIPWQGVYNNVEVLEHRQHVQVIEETTGPAVREDNRNSPARGSTLVHEVDTVPSELIESAKPLLPGTPIKVVRPVGHEVLQPIQVRALFPTYAGHLVGPSCTSYPCSQIIDHFIVP